MVEIVQNIFLHILKQIELKLDSLPERCLVCLAQTRGSGPDLANLVPPCGLLRQSWTLFQSGDDGPLHPRYRHPQFASQKVIKGLKFYPS